MYQEHYPCSAKASAAAVAAKSAWRWTVRKYLLVCVLLFSQFSVLFSFSTDGVRKAGIELQKIEAEVPARVAEAKARQAEADGRARRNKAKAKETEVIQETEQLRLKLRMGHNSPMTLFDLQQYNRNALQSSPTVGPFPSGIALRSSFDAR